MKALVSSYGRTRLSREPDPIASYLGEAELSTPEGRARADAHENSPIGDLIFLSQFVAEFLPELFDLFGLLLAEMGNKTRDADGGSSIPNSESALLFGLRGASAVAGPFEPWSRLRVGGGE